VNGPFEDPGLYLDFRFGRRAILFDCGDLTPLSSRELMRVSHVFVSHTHMDHFGGFDRLLRVCLHRPAPLHLVGPEGFIDQIESRIRSYTWNLLGDHSIDFALHAATFAQGRLTEAAWFRAREAFRRRAAPVPSLPERVVLEEDAFRVEAVELDHGIPSLAFALREPVRVNVWRGALESMDLPVGPWLAEAKRSIRIGMADETIVAVPEARPVTLGELKADALRVGPGQSVVYVTDAAGSPENARAVLSLAKQADQIFIEAVFLEEDRALAEATRHLTAAEAGRLAGLAGAKHLTVFHHSARYIDRPDRLRDEALAAFARARGEADSEKGTLQKAAGHSPEESVTA
jgi:ribonuclease Z